MVWRDVSRSATTLVAKIGFSEQAPSPLFTPTIASNSHRLGMILYSTGLLIWQCWIVTPFLSL